MKKISQSFVVDMRSYMAGGSCGHLIREKWIHGKLLESDSKAMKLGAYFEYIFTLAMTGTGSLPKDGKVPQAEMMVSGKDMLAPYRLAHTNSLRLQEYFKLMGIKILSAGKVLTKGKFQGTLDLICEATKRIEWANGEVWEIGYQFVIDLKYAGTLDDRWSPYGWAGLKLPGENEQKKIHGTQAVQYHFLTGLDFYFMVVSSTNDIDVKFFQVQITGDQVEAHIAEANDLEEKLKFYHKIGLEPRPDISKCAECALRGECKDRATYPQIETIML